jgi:hypothetical protein
MWMVIDSSFLRSPDMEAFLRENPANMAVLSEVTALETYKGDPLRNAAANFAICGRYAAQIWVLRCVRDIIDAERQQIMSPAEYIDVGQTAHFARYCCLLDSAVAGDKHVRAQIAAHSVAALTKIAATPQRGFAGR